MGAAGTGAAGTGAAGAASTGRNGFVLSGADAAARGGGAGGAAAASGALGATVRPATPGTVGAGARGGGAGGAARAFATGEGGGHGRESVVGSPQRDRIEGSVNGGGRGRLSDHRCFRDGWCLVGWGRGRGGGIVSPIVADGCAALTALDRDYLARHPPVVDVVRHREAVATLGANDGPGHRPVAYTAAALMASKFWVMHGAMKPVSRGRKEVRSRYPSGAWLLACWLVALPVHADPPGADLSSRPRSGPDMLADLGADSAPPTKDPRAHAVSADAPHDAHDHPSADEPDDVDDV